MKLVKFSLILIIIITAFSSCAVRPAGNVVMVKKQKPARVVVVKPAHRKNVVVVNRRRI